MRTNPKPNHLIFVLNSNGTIFNINPNGIHRLCGMHTFKTQARIKGVLSELFINLFGLMLDLGWQLGEGFAEAFRCMGNHK